jgi:hypothetical protein
MMTLGSKSVSRPGPRVRAVTIPLGRVGRSMEIPAAAVYWRAQQPASSPASYSRSTVVSQHCCHAVGVHDGAHGLAVTVRRTNFHAAPSHRMTSS